jgi:putative transposase
LRARENDWPAIKLRRILLGIDSSLHDRTIAGEQVGRGSFSRTLTETSMPRWPRLVSPALPMHITQRGHNRELTFHDEHDYAYYMETLIEASAASSCAVHAYALMQNHVHLLITPAHRTGPARLLQRVGSRYVRYWNKRHHRSGTMWEGRFRSSIVDSDRYLLTCSRYIDMNPVRAGIVVDAESYQWSSYRRLAQGADDAIVRPHVSYLALGTSSDDRERAYREFCQRTEPVHKIDLIRTATHGGGASGDSRFHAGLERLLKRPTIRAPHGGDRKSSVWQTSLRQ